MSFPFNNGLGPGGCSGQSPQNCNTDFSGCCTMPAGPVMSSRMSNGVSFREMTPMEKSQIIKASKRPNLRAGTSMFKVPSVPQSGVGVI
jgi:hypothetical protein